MAIIADCLSVDGSSILPRIASLSRISLVVKLVVWDHGSGVRFTHPRPVLGMFQQHKKHQTCNLKKQKSIPVDYLGAVVGYGSPLQGGCLEGFDFLGLHQILDL